MSLQDLRYCSLDCETTGLSAIDGHQIVEIAVVSFHRDGIEERWSTLVNPGRTIPEDAIRVHGIRDGDVARSPKIADVLPTVAEKTAGRVLVAHNASFDLEFVTSACYRNGLDPIDRPLLDTLLVSRTAFPEASSHNLMELATRVGVAPESAHRALADAVTTAHVWMALLRRAAANAELRLLPPDSIERILRHPELQAPALS